MIQERHNKEKKMSLETPASRLASRLQQVNPAVSIEIAEQIISASLAAKEKIVEQYGFDQTESWIEDVKTILDI